MNELYYDLLNINQNISIGEIDKIVKNNISGIKNKEGLCKFFANNIGFDLDKKNIDFKEVYIEDYIDTDYFHEFLIAYYIDKEIKYVLIDPSYSQFLPNGKLFAFKKWPSELLKEENEELLNNLINKGYSEVTEKEIKQYLSSFDSDIIIKNINFKIDDLIIFGDKIR